MPERDAVHVADEENDNDECRRCERDSRWHEGSTRAIAARCNWSERDEACQLRAARVAEIHTRPVVYKRASLCSVFSCTDNLLPIDFGLMFSKQRVFVRLESRQRLLAARSGFHPRLVIPLAASCEQMATDARDLVSEVSNYIYFHNNSFRLWRNARQLNEYIYIRP